MLGLRKNDYLWIFKGEPDEEYKSCTFEYEDEEQAPCLVNNFCGSDLPGRIVSEKVTNGFSKLFLYFETDDLIEKAGFRFNYRQIGEYANPLLAFFST